MSNHKNHGNRPPRINGFRDGKAPAIVPTQNQVTYKMGLDADAEYVVVEWNKPITNIQLQPAAVDDLIRNLQGAKAALLDAQTKKDQT